MKKDERGNVLGMGDRTSLEWTQWLSGRRCRNKHREKEEIEL